MRPEQLTIVDAHEGRVAGEIVDVTVVGGVSHVAVRLDGRDDPIVVAGPSCTSHRAGERVGVHVPVADVVVLPG